MSTHDGLVYGALILGVVIGLWIRPLIDPSRPVPRGGQEKHPTARTPPPLSTRGPRDDR